MTVSSTIYTVSYTGDGSGVTFPVTFPFLGTGSSSELTVVQRVIATGVETTLTYTTHYTVTGGSGLTGTVTAASAPAVTVQWHIRRNTTTTQVSDYVTNDPFSADTVERNFDRLTMTGQERDGDITQTFSFPDTYTGGASTTMPEPVANAHLKWNVTASALETSTSSVAQYLGGNGTALLPFYSHSDDPNSGAWRVGADQLGWSVNGVKGLDLSTTGLTVTGTISATTGTFSGVVSVDDTTDTSSGTTGSVHTDGGLGIAKKLFVGTSATVSGVLTTGGDILSDTDSTDSLGSTGVRWLKIWVDSIQTTADIAVGADLTIAGDLTVNGTTTTVDSTNMVVKDPLIELNTGASSNANDLGLIMERGSTGDNCFMGWDESGDYFAFGTTTATGASTGNISYSFGEIRASGAVFSGTSSNLGTVTTVDINGGSLDGAVIGGASPAAITGTTLTANTSITLATGGAMTGVLDSDTMTGATAALLSTSESIKAYVDNSSKAAGISMTWETATTDTDQGVGKVWANNATLSSATVLYFDDVERNSVSINALIDSLDDPTASNSATIYIQEAGSATAGVLFKVSGNVVSASTYSKVTVTHQATFGTLSDGDVVGVTFAFSGDDGAGSGTVTQINAGDGFSFSAITTTGTIAVDGVLQDLDTLGPVSSDGEILVGTGSGAFAWESGATARTSLGIGAADSVDSDQYVDGSIDSAHLADDAVTLAKMASGTDGVIITYDASGNPTHVGPGSDGQVLTSTGAGSPPAFEDAGGGAWAVASSGTFSSASTLSITSITKFTRIILSNIKLSNSGDVNVRTSSDGGSSYDSGTDYNWVSFFQHSNNGNYNGSNSTGADLIKFDADSFNADTDEDGYFQVTIPNPTDTASYSSISWIGGVFNGTVSLNCSGMGARLETAAINAVQFFPNSGTFDGSYVVLELN